MRPTHRQYRWDPHILVLHSSLEEKKGLWKRELDLTGRDERERPIAGRACRSFLLQREMWIWMKHEGENHSPWGYHGRNLSVRRGRFRWLDKLKKHLEAAWSCAQRPVGNWSLLEAIVPETAMTLLGYPQSKYMGTFLYQDGLILEPVDLDVEAARPQCCH